MLRISKIFIVLGLMMVVQSVAHGEVGVTDTEIVIGGHTTESGPLAAAAAIGPRGAAAYFDWVNEQGGVYGRKIKYIRKDTQSLAPKTVEATRQLIELEKVFAMVFSQGPSHIAVAQYISDKGVPDMFFSDAAKVYGDLSKHKTNFQEYVPYSVEAKAAITWAAENKKGKKFCMLATKDTLGEDFVAALKEVVPELSAKLKTEFSVGEVVRVDRFGNQADSEVLSLKEQKCDVVTIAVIGPMVANAINYGSSQGFKPLWIVENVNVSNKFIGLLNKDIAEGVVSTANVARDPSMAKKEAWDKYEALMKKNNVPAIGTSIVGYQAAETFVETLKRAGKNLTREGLMKAALSYKGDWQCSLCLNPLKAEPNSHYLFGPPRVIAIKDGKWQLVK